MSASSVTKLARLACELEFVLEPETAQVAARSSPALRDIAPERVFMELKLIVRSDLAVEGLELMDSLGITDAILPELSRLRGIEQSQYHHLDVHEHTRAVLAETIELDRDPGRWFGDQADAIARLLAEPLANDP